MRQQTQRKQRRLLQPRCPVCVRDFGMGGIRWRAGTVVSADDSMATVELTDGRWIRRHLDHVRAKSDPEVLDDVADTQEEPAVDAEEMVVLPPTQGEMVDDSPADVVDKPECQQTTVPTTSTATAAVERQTDDAGTTTATADAVREDTSTGSRVRRSGRFTQNQAPLRFKDYVV